MGGEPLLHPRVAEVVRMTRAFLPGERVSLCTNGLLLRRMRDDFWDTLAACDVALIMSVYPIKLDYQELAEFARGEGVRVLLARDITHTADGKEAFMRLALDPEGGCDPGESFVSCPFGGHYMQLARGALWPCQVAAHHDAFAKRFGFNMHASSDDALLLDSIGSVSQIETFRRRPHPMCRHCDNDALTVMPWGRSKLSADEWLAPR